uniref:Reverse transcriptase (RNA-dependent DNA polymerase) n=1 Tax=Candidatus Kentrum sp. LPFa TaxID=2126335 RepID=A0A450X8V9_9GAMM|nr:MAG: hypothetical protein BECKLPF1236B_GA0070989_15141 [Candidatus Kentron sp. LPFa]
MREAFKNVKRNRGAAGIDKVSVQMFEANLDENLDNHLAGPQALGKLSVETFPKVIQRRGVHIPTHRDRSLQTIVTSHSDAS